jgi:hypothetical protein
MVWCMSGSVCYRASRGSAVARGTIKHAFNVFRRWIAVHDGAMVGKPAAGAAAAAISTTALPDSLSPNLSQDREL